MNKEERKEYNKKYRESHKEERRIWEIKNKKKRKEYVKNYNKKYRENNQEKINLDKNKYQKIKKKQDKNFCVICLLRSKLNRVLEHYTKTGKIYHSKKYRIDYQAIIEHLKPFPENLKDYDIHHIKPLSSFNFVNPDGSTNLEEIKKAFIPENHKWLNIEEHKEIHNRGKLIK